MAAKWLLPAYTGPDSPQTPVRIESREEVKHMDWQKSSKSNPSGNSIEVAWQKSGASESGASVEVAEGDGTVMIRESDDPEATIATTREKFRAFIDGVKAGEFDHFAE